MSPDDKPLLDWTLREFLDQLGSATPPPGGGSVAALAASLAAGLGQMAVQFTVGRPKFAAVEGRVRELGERLSGSDHMLRRLMTEDSSAYVRLLEALRMDKGDPNRAAAVQSAAGTAAAVPLEIAALSKRVLADLKALAASANPNLRSDVEAGLHLASAALAAAAANTRVNLPYMEKEAARRVEEELAALVGGKP